MRRCDKCAFYFPTGVHQGQCRKQPPTTLVLPHNAPPGFTVNGAWPGTPANGWCGEWKMKFITQEAIEEKENERTN
jgi:hypothetical protein